MSLVRVRDKITGHQYTIHESQFAADRHEETGGPAADANGVPTPPSYAPPVAEETGPPSVETPYNVFPVARREEENHG